MIVCTKYGPPDVLQLKDVEKPTPKDNEVLVKAYAATVTSANVILRIANPLVWLPMRTMFGLRKPKRPILGDVRSLLLTQFSLQNIILK